MTRKQSLIAIFFSCSGLMLTSTAARAQSTFCEKIIVDTMMYNIGTSIVQTSDKGYAIAGAALPINILPDSSLYVIKIDSMGNIQWTRIIGGVQSGFPGYFGSIKQTPDNGYLVSAFQYYSGPGYGDIYLLKLDSVGNILWANMYGGSTGRESSGSLLFTNDGNYAVCGTTWSYGVDSSDFYFVKVDTNGNVLWTKSIGGNRLDDCYHGVQSNDNGYILTGRTNSYGAGNFDVYVVKIDSTGNLVWTKTIGGANDDEGYSIVKTVSNEFIISGYTSSFGAGQKDIYLIKIDNSGNVLWAKTFGSPGNEIGYSVDVDLNGEYFIGGITDSLGAGFWDGYFIKTDSSGSLLWARTSGGSSYDEVYSVTKTVQGGYAFTGYTVQPTGSYTEVLVGILNSAGNGCCASVATAISGTGGIFSSGGVDGPAGALTISAYQDSSGGNVNFLCNPASIDKEDDINKARIFPNPSSGIFEIYLERVNPVEKIEISVFNVVGQKIYFENTPVNGKFIINLMSEPNGIYFLGINAQDIWHTLFNEKIIVQK